MQDSMPQSSPEEIAVNQIMQVAAQLKSDPAKFRAFRDRIGQDPRIITSLKKYVPRNVLRDTFSDSSPMALSGQRQNVPLSPASSSGVDLKANAPEPKIGILATPYDSIDAVKAPQQLSALIMGQAEALRKDPIQFQKYRDEVVLKNQAALDALKKTYDPKFLELFFSGAGLPTVEDRTRQATEAKTVDLESAIRTVPLQSELGKITAKQKAFQEAYGRRAYQEASLENSDVEDEVAVKNALRKQKVEEAVANSPEGKAAAEQEFVTLQKKQDILAGTKAKSYAQIQEAKATENFAGQYATMFKDYNPDGVPDEEGFGAKFVNNTGTAARSTEKPIESLVTVYHKARFLPDEPKEVENQIKTAEKNAFLSLMTDKTLDEAGKQKRINALKASMLLGGEPSPYYFAYLRYQKEPLKVQTEKVGFFKRMFSGNK